MSVILYAIRRKKIDREIRGRDQTYLGRKAWVQSDMMSNTWVTACLKEHSSLNAKQFPEGGANLFRGGSDMPEWIDWTEDTTKSRKREEDPGDGVCRIW